MFRNKEMDKALNKINNNINSILDGIFTLVGDLDRQNHELGKISNEAMERAEYYDKVAYDAECQVQDNMKVIRNMLNSVYVDENINE